MEKVRVKDMWKEENSPSHFKNWRDKEWWKDVSSEENLEELWEILKTWRIPLQEGEDIIRWGYS